MDINSLKDSEVKKLMKGCDTFVYAAGVDERIEFAPPVYDKYYEFNIKPLVRLLTIAKSVGVKKSVILGSYFSHFAKTRPELNLYKHHPYIRSRIDQENEALAFNDDKMEVMVLELPYIFGAQKGRKPVWMLYIDLLLPMEKAVYYPKGGTTMVTVNQVGQCIAGAVEKGKGGKCYPVGWFNMEWTELLAIINKYMGCEDKKIVTIPTFLYKLASYKMAKDYKKQNIEPGLNPVKFVKLMTSNCFIDKDVIKNELGVKDDNIDKAIGESITYSLEIHNSKAEVVEMQAK